MSLLFAGCGLLGGADVGERTTVGGAAAGSISVDELDQATKNFADRFVLHLADACDDIKSGTTSAAMRRAAHRLKLTGATAAYDVATGPDAVRQLLDMVILVDLHHRVWVVEGQAAERFGEELGGQLAAAFRTAREEIRKLSRTLLSVEQIRALERAIEAWRHRHPDVTWISNIRFDVVAGGQGAAVIGETLGELTPLSGNITDSIGQLRLLGQRAFYYSKRLPTLLDWQIEAAADHAFEIPAATELLGRVSRTLDAAAALLAQLDRLVTPPPDGEQDPRIRELREILTEGRDLADATGRAASTVETMLEDIQALREPVPIDPAAEPSVPFVIADYTAAAVAIAEAAQRTRDLLRETRDLAGDPSSSTPNLADTMDDLTRRLGDEARDVTDHAAGRAALLIALVAVLVAIGAVALMLVRRRSRVRSA